jgi:site-specific DNA-cytosine methylase
MSKKNRDIISEKLGVEPIKINTSLFLPQQRRRYYWANIPYDSKTLPTENTEITVQDLLEEKVEDKYYYSEHNKKVSFVTSSFNSKPAADLPISRTLKTMAYTGRAAVDNCYYTTYKPEGKTNLRKLTPIEYERLQGLGNNYTSMLSNTQRYKTIGNCFSIPVIKWFLQNIF